MLFRSLKNREKQPKTSAFIDFWTPKINFRSADAANHVNRDVTWCEAFFYGFSGFGFGRVGRICLWAGLADQVTASLASFDLQRQQKVQFYFDL